MRVKWGDEIEGAARSSDFRERAVAYRAVGQFRFRQKIELLRRGLEDESPAARGSALISLELLSRDQPGLRQRRPPAPSRARELATRTTPCAGSPSPPAQRLAAARDDRAPGCARRGRRAGPRAAAGGVEGLDRAPQARRAARLSQGSSCSCRPAARGRRKGRCGGAASLEGVLLEAGLRHQVADAAGDRDGGDGVRVEHHRQGLSFWSAGRETRERLRACGCAWKYNSRRRRSDTWV